MTTPYEQFKSNHDRVTHMVGIVQPPLDQKWVEKLRELIKDYFDTNDREPEEIAEFMNMAATWASTRDLMGLHAAVLLGLCDVGMELTDDG